LARRARAFKSEKRRKELKRQKKQEQKRLKRQGKDEAPVEEPGTGPAEETAEAGEPSSS
jgi:hypothetical protein